MYTLKITWADLTDLANCTDEAVLVESADWRALRDIGDDADFLLWALETGCTQVELWYTVFGHSDLLAFWGV